MKVRGFGFVVFGLGALLVASCFQPPEYSPIPIIEFDKIVFRDAPSPAFDTISLSVKFKDGDGDLGLASDIASDTLVPYNNKFYFVFSDGTFITYKTKRTNPNYDTLPAYVQPYNCTNWQITTLNKKTDTVYFQLNPNHYNIFVDWFVKNNDGSFTEFNWLTAFDGCATYDGRFPRLSADYSHKAPMEGTIKYNMQSSGFLILFSIKTLKLRVTIQDRALHKSNTIETPEFTLQSIKK